MGLLDQEALESISGMLNGNNIEVEDDSSSNQSSDSNESSADAPQDESSAQSDATEDVKEDVEVEESDDGDQGNSHHVPYSRFKNVLDARNTHKSELEQLKREISQLRKQESLSSEQSYDDSDDYFEGSDLDDIFNDDSDYGVQESPEAGSQMSEVLKRIEHFEVYQAEQELTREVSSAKEQYPNVPDDVIYQAIARDPSLSVISIAEQYSSFVGGVEEAAISKYMKEHNMENPQAEASPRPARSGAPPLRHGSAEKAPPRNLTEAKGALREYLANNNIFKR